uniref:Replication protein A 14 kDa subunit n=1 Tax=Arion vulgaris TaxID=1028688 RepID=A0A0B6ZMJ7_9EUPU
MSIDDLTKPRVNASLLPNFHGKHVCLLGSAKNVDNSGHYFTLVASDNQDVRIQMQEPLNQRVTGLVEVHGTVISRNSVRCENLVVFSDEASQKFDMALYQKAVEYVHRCSNLYIQGGIMED